MRRIFLAVAIIVLVAIVILSVVPPAWRPLTRVPHDIEHFVVFALAGTALALGLPRRRLTVAIAIAVFAGVVEIAQLSIPGRHARVSDFVVDTLGAWFGLAMCVVLDAMRAGDRSGAGDRN